MRASGSNMIVARSKLRRTSPKCASLQLGVEAAPSAATGSIKGGDWSKIRRYAQCALRMLPSVTHCSACGGEIFGFEDILGHGAAEPVSLRLVTVEQTQQTRLLLCLYALRDHIEVHGMRQIDDGRHQGKPLRTRSHVDHEGAVDFQSVHRQPGQIAQR